MHHLNLASVPEAERRSTGGRFRSFFRNLSLALGGPDLRQPFDLQLRRLPPGAAVCPLHQHYNQWELFVVRAGTGTVRADGGRYAVATGDVFVHPPGAAHQLINTGTTDLEVLIVADNPSIDACYYPDSDKWLLRPPGKCFRMVECEYVDGEDPTPAGAIEQYRIAPPTPAPALPPFAQRRVAIDALPWVNFDSPKRKFRGESKELSVALGAVRNEPVNRGGHPFELELGRLPAGYSGCPYHSHAAQWECYWILEGSASFRHAAGALAAGPGDLVLFPPGEPHQFTNVGATELTYFLVADNPPVDIWQYPDSGKWGFNAPRKFFRATDADYWDGEE